MLLILLIISQDRREGADEGYYIRVSSYSLLVIFVICYIRRILYSLLLYYVYIYIYTYIYIHIYIYIYTFVIAVIRTAAKARTSADLPAPRSPTSERLGENRQTTERNIQQNKTTPKNNTNKNRNTGYPAAVADLGNYIIIIISIK